jgi:hypothetical protein
MRGADDFVGTPHPQVGAAGPGGRRLPRCYGTVTVTGWLTVPTLFHPSMTVRMTV